MGAEYLSSEREDYNNISTNSEEGSCDINLMDALKGLFNCDITPEQYQGFREHCLRTTLSMLNGIGGFDKGLAEEIVDQTLFQFLILDTTIKESIPKNDGKFRKYIKISLKNTYIDICRRERKFTEGIALDNPDDDGITPAEKLSIEPPWLRPTEEKVIRREELREAKNKLETEDIMNIKVIELYVQGYKYDEIAEELKIPLGTVKSKLSRTLGRLREELEPDKPVTQDESLFYSPIKENKQYRSIS